MKDKKPTNAQLQRRIDLALVFVPKDKGTRSVYFDDKGLRLTVTEDFAIVETPFHRHVFARITGGGFSRPYIFIENFIAIATTHHALGEVKIKDSEQQGEVTVFSYAKFIKALEDDKKLLDEYNQITYVDMWLNNIFFPLYRIGESTLSHWCVYLDYVSELAMQSVIYGKDRDRGVDVTDKMFIEKYVELIKSLSTIDANHEPRVVIPHEGEDEALSQMMREADAMYQAEVERAMTYEQKQSEQEV